MDSQLQQSDQSLAQPRSALVQAGGVSPAPAQPAAASSTTQHSPGSDAEGSGLTELDRAYIDRTISAVEEASGDPYSQSQAVNSIRNDYLRERFGKQIDA